MVKNFNFSFCIHLTPACFGLDPRPVLFVRTEGHPCNSSQPNSPNSPTAVRWSSPPGSKPFPDLQTNPFSPTPQTKYTICTLPTRTRHRSAPTSLPPPSPSHF